MKYLKDLVNKVILGDCLEVMLEIPNESIDMILCDLPYGKTSRNKWDIVISFDELWKQYKRIIKNSGAIVLTCMEPFTSQLIVSNIEMFRHDLIWIKNRKTGFLNAKKMPLRQHENILVFYKSLPVYNPQKTQGHKPVNSFTKHSSDGTNYGETKLEFKGGGQTDRYPSSIVNIKCVDNDSKQRIHPTQKPVELFEYLIKTYSNEGMIVLDNCIGSGTTAIACLHLKRNFIGIEKDEKYFDKCLERISNERKIP